MSRFLAVVTAPFRLLWWLTRVLVVVLRRCAYRTVRPTLFAVIGVNRRVSRSTPVDYDTRVLFWRGHLGCFRKAHRQRSETTIRSAYDEMRSAFVAVEAKAVGAIQLAAIVGAGIVFMLRDAKSLAWYMLALVALSGIYLVTAVISASVILHPRARPHVHVRRAIESAAGVDHMAATVEASAVLRTKATNLLTASYVDLTRSAAALLLGIAFDVGRARGVPGLS